MRERHGQLQLPFIVCSPKLYTPPEGRREQNVPPQESWAKRPDSVRNFVQINYCRAGNISDDSLLQLVLQHKTKKKLYSIQKEAERLRREFELLNLDRAANERVTKFAKKQKVKQQAQDIEVRQWEEKELQGRYPERIREADVDDYKTNQGLRSTRLKAETEGLIIVVQEQSLPTKSCYARIVKDGTSPLRRILNKHEETVDHIISGCP